MYVYVFVAEPCTSKWWEFQYVVGHARSFSSIMIRFAIIVKIN